jgi:prephenate dehydrogenase
MGGSLARDLAERGHDILGYDRAPDVLSAARASGVLRETCGPDLQGLEQAEIVALAVPVDGAVRLLSLAQPRLKYARLITDLGGTKRAICAHAEALGLGPRFVGAHPFAGDHRSGWDASRSGLFQGARVFLCPVAQTTPGALNDARALWESVGARIEVVDAAVHDQRLAWSSHLPQLAASALALVLAQETLPPAELGRGGRDVTRLAASDPDLWTGIALQNADYLSQGLAALESRLAELRRNIEQGNQADVRALFGRALRWSFSQPSSSSTDSDPAPDAHSAQG